MKKQCLSILLASSLLLASGVALAETQATEEAPAQASPQIPLDTRNPIERVKKSRLMAGEPDGEFTPEKHLTRAELAKILVKAFDIAERSTPGPKQVNVQDVPTEQWAYPENQTALQHGLMEGYREGVFHPSHPVSRAEGFAIFAQAYGVHQFEEETVDEIMARYPDTDQVPDWARQALATALRFGFVNTDEMANRVYPNQTLTRGDLAYALSKYLNRKEGVDLGPSEEF